MHKLVCSVFDQLTRWAHSHYCIIILHTPRFFPCVSKQKLPPFICIVYWSVGIKNTGWIAVLSKILEIAKTMLRSSPKCSLDFCSQKDFVRAPLSANIVLVALSRMFLKLEQACEPLWVTWVEHKSRISCHSLDDKTAVAWLWDIHLKHYWNFSVLQIN